MALVRGIVSRGRSLVRRADGASATEYAIMVALIVLVAIVAIAGIGLRMETVYSIIEESTPSV